MVEQVGSKETVFNVVGMILTKLDAIRHESSGKAALANLRQSIGRPVSETIEVWPLIFEFIPNKFLGKRGELTKEETAILTTIQLYALHQQGVEQSVLKYNEKGQWDNIGLSMKVLRTDDKTVPVDRRFNTMITASTFEELSHHLRQMIQLLKAKHRSEQVNYPQLAEDLLSFLWNKEERVRLNWAKAYYGQRNETEKGDINHD